MRVPGRCRAHVPDRLFETNIFRVVLNCLTDPDMPMLAGRRFLNAQTLEVRPDPGFSG